MELNKFNKLVEACKEVLTEANKTMELPVMDSKDAVTDIKKLGLSVKAIKMPAPGRSQDGIKITVKNSAQEKKLQKWLEDNEFLDPGENINNLYD
jgi:hypothetical protein